LREAGVQLAFMPTTEVMYPRGVEEQTFVEVPGLGDILEGKYRPGHFRGVATVVNRLLNMVQPDTAVFGKKDYQQLLLIRRMVDDLAMPVEIIAGETEREPDGLAMSSRNSRLSEAQRRDAAGLHRALVETGLALKKGGDVTEVTEKQWSRLESLGFRPDYLSVRRRSDLQPPERGDIDLVVLVAAFLGDVRLIDNLEISLNQPA